MVEKISLGELEAKIRDPNVPEGELRRYLVGDRRRSGPFRPVVKPDPRRVDLASAPAGQVAAASAMEWGNGFARWRRQLGFELRRAQAPTAPVMITEGDSWFQYPFLIDDVVDWLWEDQLVYDTSAAGDTLAAMAFKSQDYIVSLERHRAHAWVLMISGGGNDVVGEDENEDSMIRTLVRPFEPGRPASWYIDTDACRAKLADVERAHEHILTTIGREFPGLPVVLHGYDHAIPHAGSGDPRKPRLSAPDQWLAGPLGGDKLGIRDHRLQRQIVALLIDRLNELLAELCGGNNVGGRHTHAFHADFRGTLPEVGDWADELHPTSKGFAKITKQLRLTLEQARRHHLTAGPASAVAPSPRRATSRPAAAIAASDLGAAKIELVQRYLRHPTRAIAVAAAAAASSPSPDANVVGIGTGHRVSSGRETGELAVKVFVRRKFPLGALAPGEVIQPSFDGVPVDIEEVGDVLAANNPRLSYDRVPPGVSIGFDMPMAGTLGALVVDAAGTLFVLSNNHVLANVDRLAKGAPIFQAGLLDLPAGAAPRRVATLERFVKMRGTDPLELDAALARADQPDRFVPGILTIGKPKGTVPPVRDAVVHKFGRTSGYTVGRVTSVDTDINVGYGNETFTFHDQIVIIGLDGGQFATQGDSGSLILERSSARAIGLLFAASATHTFANHAKLVLDALQVALVGGGGRWTKRQRGRSSGGRRVG